MRGHVPHASKLALKVPGGTFGLSFQALEGVDLGPVRTSWAFITRFEGSAVRRKQGGHTEEQQN